MCGHCDGFHVQQLYFLLDHFVRFINLDVYVVVLLHILFIQLLVFFSKQLILPPVLLSDFVWVFFELDSLPLTYLDLDFVRLKLLEQLHLFLELLLQLKLKLLPVKHIVLVDVLLLHQIHAVLLVDHHQFLFQCVADFLCVCLDFYAL
jgi:hypothetical protein